MYRKSAKGWMKHIDFIIIDVVCLQIAFVLACITRQGVQNIYANQLYLNMAIVLTIVDLFIAVFFESFKNVLKRGRYQEFASSLKHAVLTELLATFYLFSVQDGGSFSRTILYLTGAYFLVITYVARIARKKYLQERKIIRAKRSLVVITTKDMAEHVLQNLLNNNYEAFRLAGIILIDDEELTSVLDVPVVAHFEDAADYVCREWVDEVFIALPEGMAYPDEFLDKFTEMGVAVHFKIAENRELSKNGQFIEKIGNYTVITSAYQEVTLSQVFLKRMLDIAGGLVGTIMTGILYLFVAPAIWILSPGPVFFKQERIGKNGKRFKMYKFRSMYLDAEERKAELMEKNRIGDGLMFKCDEDVRIIGSKITADGTYKKGFGNYLRDLSIDEFPQFINVLKGDMSLVGTRPPTVDEWEKYKLHHRARLAVRPGVTGLWQVSGRSNITEFEEVVKLDTKYIKSWNIGMDLKILLKTVKTVLWKDGAL